MHPAALVILYVTVAMAPLSAAAVGLRPPRSIPDELASGAGMLAFAIVLVEFVLSGRFRTISRRMGMDVTMRCHQLFARTALVLAIVHPFLYRAPFKEPLPWDPTRQLTLTAEPISLTSGILAWVLLIALVILSIGRRRLDFSYETWRLMHGLGALAIASLILLHTLTGGRYAADPVVADIWIGLFAVAVATLLYVYVLAPLAEKRRPWKLASVTEIAPQTWELSIEPAGHEGLSYEAGQFAWLNVGNGPFSLKENPFSISSAPKSGPNLQFLIRELGDFTRTIRSLRPGTPVFIDGPHGNLVVAGRHEPGIAFIGAGVGIAPLLSNLRQLALVGDRRPTLLVFGSRSQSHIPYRDEIDSLADRHRTSVHHLLSRPEPGWTGQRGRIDANVIRSLFRPEMRQWLFVLCGPTPLMETVEDALVDLGVAAGQILSERFDYD